MIELTKIQTFPQQPRETFDKVKIRELADSINAQGLIEPIVVRELDGGVYQIIAGERRWRAFSLLKKKEIPAIIWDVKTDGEAAEKSLVENWHREDLERYEIATMVYQIKTEGNYSNKELAKRLGKSDGVINDYLKLYEYVQSKGGWSPSVSKITTEDISRTSVLDDDTKSWVLEKRARDEIPQKEIREIAKTLKKAPEPLKKAIVEEKVDLGDARRFVEIGIPEEMEEQATEELIIRKKERDEIEELTIATDEAILKGEIKAKGIKVDRSADEKRLAKFENIRDTVRYWRVLDVRMIKTPALRDKAIEYVREIAETATALLHQLQSMKMEGLEEG